MSWSGLPTLITQINRFIMTSLFLFSCQLSTVVNGCTHVRPSIMFNQCVHPHFFCFTNSSSLRTSVVSFESIAFSTPQNSKSPVLHRSIFNRYIHGPLSRTETSSTLDLLDKGKHPIPFPFTFEYSPFLVSIHSHSYSHLHLHFEPSPPTAYVAPAIY